MIKNKMNYRFLIFLLLVCNVLWIKAAKKEQVSSPNGELKLDINISDKIYYSVTSDNDLLLKDCYLQLVLENEILGISPVAQNIKKEQIDEVKKPAFPLKNAEVSNNYNALLIRFKGNYSVEFRVFDDGFAYRFITDRKQESVIAGENFVINFPFTYLAHLSLTKSFKTSYESPYSHIETISFNEDNEMTTLPVLIDTRINNKKILISESDLKDYPCMFLKGSNNNGMYAVFPKYPLEFGPDGDRSQKILKEAPYIATTTGTRNFPWRYFVISKNDSQLVENEMTFKLSSPSLITTDWIKPGQVSWEWWNDASPYGKDVNFVSGYNLDTYKYYIDFASKYGISYIIMDEGWAKNTLDPYTPNPTVNVHELIRYGKEKNVGIVLWLTWLAVENNFELFKIFSDWGVKGVKIDFMDRSDQWMVNYYERVAKEAAKYNLFVDFHGSFKPAGLEYIYPNILTYEGVRGLEQGGGCYPDNSIYLPFIRNAVGPMDFTPGAMINMQPNVYSAKRPNNAGMGTRANQMAMFVIFESPLQMLADSPTLYYKNAECTEFITQVPVTWDETRCLKAVAGEFLIVAKRKGNVWYLGAMCNGKEAVRDFDIHLDFLSEDKNLQMTSFEDGVNAGRQAMDYCKKASVVKKDDFIKVRMVKNGGWAAVIK